MKKVLIVALLWCAVCSLVLGTDKARAAQPQALLFDLTQSAMSWEAGGFGISLGYERGMLERLSLWGELIYMSLPDAPQEPQILLTCLGLRYYFAAPTIQGFFLGCYGMAGTAISGSNPSFLAGLRAELGLAWRVGRQKRLLIEPYIMYPYFFGEDLLLSIAPGVSLGYRFD